LTVFAYFIGENFMNRSTSWILLAAGILLSLSHGAYAAPPADIQMLPPVDFSNNTCAGGKAGILYWDGTTTIKCIPGSLGDAGGDVTAAGTVTAGNLSTGGQVTSNSLLLSGATGVLNDTDANVLLSVAAQSCGSDEALSISGGVASCVSILGLAKIGPATFPDCGPTAAITWNGANFSCATIPAATPPASVSCATGFMTGISGGSTAFCGLAAAINTSCGAGQFQTGVDGSGNPICSAPPSAPTPPACTAAGYGLQFDGTNYQCVLMAGTPCGGTFPDNTVASPTNPGFLGYSALGEAFLCQPDGTWGLGWIPGAAP
jgi:hypothetical protein